MPSGDGIRRSSQLAWKRRLFRDLLKRCAVCLSLKATLSALQTATRNLNTSISSIRGLAEHRQNRADPLLLSLRTPSHQASLTLAQISSTVAMSQTSLAPDALLTYRLEIALGELL